MTSNKLNVIGILVDRTDMGRACEAICDSAASGGKGIVCVTGAHGVIEAQSNSELRDILNTAMLNVPDGMPLVWSGKLRGFKDIGRVYGPELMDNICRMTVAMDIKHFFYGGKPGIAEELKSAFETKYPGIKITGTFTPPFRPLNDEEMKKLTDTLDRTKPDIIWVGLSTPKQEFFMKSLLPRISRGVLLGVGAAFDIHTGHINDAPQWMKNAGLQWFHRLCQEPSRLAGRYLKIVPTFAWLSFLQLTGLRRFPTDFSAETRDIRTLCGQLTPLWLLLLAATIALSFSVNVKVIDAVTINTVLPSHFEGWTDSDVYYCHNKDCMRPLISGSKNVTVCPECGAALAKNWSLAEKNILPQDTVLSKKAYTDALGHLCMVTIVTSGKEHTSIHRPQMCLVAQGNEITKEQKTKIELGNNRTLELSILNIRRLLMHHSSAQQGFYAYWFVGDNIETASHIKRMWHSATSRIFRGHAIRWSYISISGINSDAGETSFPTYAQELTREIYRSLHSNK